MKYLKIIFILLFYFNISSHSYSGEIYFINVKKILNESKARKEAQEYLKKKFVSESKKFEKESASLKKEEKDLIEKKKLITPEEYKKNINSLREKSISFQKKRQKSSSDFLKKKNEAKQKLLKSLDPIIKKYMDDNKIAMIVDEKSIIMSNSKLDLTDEIIKILNTELKTLNLN